MTNLILYLVIKIIVTLILIDYLPVIIIVYNNLAVANIKENIEFLCYCDAAIKIKKDTAFQIINKEISSNNLLIAHYMIFPRSIRFHI